MVGPSFTEEDRRVASRRLKAGFVLLVGVSAGLVSYRAGASLAEGAIVVGASLAVGAALLWFVVRLLRQMQPPDPRRPRQ